MTVCDARPVFATPTRFPDADEVVVSGRTVLLEPGRPIDQRTVVCVLTHDPKFDVPLLEVALRLPGSLRRRDGFAPYPRRPARPGSREAGVTDAEIARLSSPIGLDLGARTPEETAVTIAAEIIAGRWGGSGQPLRSTAGPIHRDIDVLP